MFTGGFVQTNAYLVESPDGNFLVDAPEGSAKWVTGLGVRVDDVLLTHQHYDHVTDAAAIAGLGARLHAFSEYSPELTLETKARAWGMPISVTPFQVDQRLMVGEVLRLAGVEILMAHVPGHSLDSVTFYVKSEGVLFSGDTLFQGSVGRTDLPGGSTEQLLAGIERHLMKLPPETRVLPGHGGETSIGLEVRTNPYLRG